MRRLLLILLLLAAVLAVEIDPETGCEKYSDHVVCPQATDVEVEIRYTADVDCFAILNEFNSLESLGCYSNAELVKPLEYESCSVYVPFDTDVILEGIDYEYQCSTEILDAGTELITIGIDEMYSNCEVVEQEEYGIYSSCPTDGQKYTVTGSIAYENNSYSLLFYTHEKHELGGADIVSPLLLLVVIVLLIYAAYVWTERKKK